MNKLKLVLGCGSLALSLFATGCGGKVCADYTAKEECNKAKDKDDKQCLWEEAEGNAKGSCKIKPEGGDGGNLTQLQQELQTAKDKIQNLESSLKNPTFVQACIPKTKMDVGSVCNIDDNSMNKKDDCEKIALGQTKLCMHKPAGKCSLLPAAAFLAIGAPFDGAWADAKITADSVTRFQVKGSGGTHIAALNAAGSFAWSENFMKVDPCAVKKKKDDCLKATVDLKATGATLLMNMANHVATGMPNLCGWDGGEDEKDACMFDTAALANIDCSAVEKDKCGGDKDITQGLCVWGNTPAVVAAPAAPEGGDGGNDNGNTNT